MSWYIEQNQRKHVCEQKLSDEGGQASCILASMNKNDSWLTPSLLDMHR